MLTLSGGVMQNVQLFQSAVSLLESNRFHVMYHNQLPPNDGCISYGQAIVAGERFKSIDEIKYRFIGNH